MSAPRPDGSCVKRAMIEALREAGLTPADVDVINAHASATALGDQAETLAIASLLGERLLEVPILATKGQHGHSLGATGVWEIAVTLCAMRDQHLPRVVNFFSTEIEPKLAIVTAPFKAAPTVALKNSSGFGGINSALVLQI